MGQHRKIFRRDRSVEHEVREQTSSRFEQIRR
jgi:hypothetical protein